MKSISKDALIMNFAVPFCAETVSSKIEGYFQITAIDIQQATVYDCTREKWYEWRSVEDELKDILKDKGRK